MVSQRGVRFPVRLFKAGFLLLSLSVSPIVQAEPGSQTMVSKLASILPPDCKVTGELEETADGLIRPKKEKGDVVTLQGVMPEGAPAIVLKGRIGKRVPRHGNGFIMPFTGEDGELVVFSIGAPESPKAIPPDGFFRLRSPNGSGIYYVRPNGALYEAGAAQKRLPDWLKMPGATDYLFTLTIRPTSPRGDKLELWLDDVLMDEVTLAHPLRDYKVIVAPNAEIESFQFVANDFKPRLVLPIAQHPRVMTMGETKLELTAPVPPAFEKLTEKKEQGIEIAGLGVLKDLAVSWSQSYFWRRHASDQLEEQRMFSVPLNVYDSAWVLCAANPDPERVNSFTLRLTRYADTRGNAMADTLVTVPEAGTPDTEDARRVGTVSYGIESARKTAPLWLLRVPIRNGWIPDLLFKDTRKGHLATHRYLDVELLDPLLNVEAFLAFPPPMDLVRRQFGPSAKVDTSRDIFDKANPPATSSVTVFGLELEKSPAALMVEASTGVKVFCAAENPEFLAKVVAEEAGTYRVKWTFADVDGKIVKTDEKTIQCAVGEKGEVKIPVHEENGWYSCRIQLIGAKNRELVDYRTSFVMLPPDTRKAGYESPFYGWCFQSNQKSEVKLDEMGPLFMRAGIRRARLMEDMPESLSQKYKLTDSTVYWSSGNLRDFQNGKMTLKESMAAYETEIRHSLELWPHIDRMLVFHESSPAGAPFPSEIWGEPVKKAEAIKDDLSPEALLQNEGEKAVDPSTSKAKALYEKTWPKRMEFITALSKMVRKEFPQLKMQYGNDGSSLGTMGELFRRKFPREWMDTMAVEDLGQTMPPERFVLGSTQTAWFLRETARKMGYGDLPVTACTEWIGRMTERLGLKTQAEWKARDGLFALAYGFDTISIAGLNDAGSGYYYSIWASGGLCGRHPDMDPKPAYAAVATLTLVLDQAKFQRFVPVGSSVLYLQEFQREGEWVYPMWTARGEREVALEFPDDAERLLVDLYGRTTSVKGATLQIQAGTGVQYLISKTQLKRATAGKSTFPEDPAPKNPIEVIPLESADAVAIIANRKPENNPRTGVPNKRSGQFEIHEVEDPEMGKCLEVELKPEGEIADIDQEYVTIAFKKRISTTANNVGIWIKGNGSSGDVDVWSSSQAKQGPWATNGNRHMSWRGLATLNFDGWNFVSYPYYDWRRKGMESEIAGLTITLPRKALVGTELAPVKNLKVRIKSVVLY